MTNHEIFKTLQHIAAAYSIKDEKKYRFQIIAYQKAADTIEHLHTELKVLYKEGKLKGLQGVGPSIQSYLGELFETNIVPPKVARAIVEFPQDSFLKKEYSAKYEDLIRVIHVPEVTGGAMATAIFDGHEDQGLIFVD